MAMRKYKVRARMSENPNQSKGLGQVSVDIVIETKREVKSESVMTKKVNEFFAAKKSKKNTLRVVKGSEVKFDEMLAPVVGMGASSGFGSDSYPYTVVGVSGCGKKVWVTEDSHEPAEGFNYFSNQVYTYESNMTKNMNEAQCFTLRSNGDWVVDGSGIKYGRKLYLGHRRYYQDPHF
jgi:hypothetical protein